MNIRFIRFITLAVVLTTAVAASAQERVDTIAVLRDISSVLLTSEADKSASEIRVEVKASGHIPAYTYKYSSKVSRPDKPLISGDSINLDLPFMRALQKPQHRMFYSILGSDIFAGPVVPVDGDGRFRTGWEVGVGKVVGLGFRPWAGGPALELGAGLLYRNLRLDGYHIFGSNDRGELFIEDLPQGCHRPSSRLDIWSVCVPLTLHQKFSHDFYLDLGVEMLLNFSARATRNYRSTDGLLKYSQTLKHLHQRTVGMDLRFALGWEEIIGLYVRYSPVSLFKSSLGPQTDFVSAGVTFVF